VNVTKTPALESARDFLVGLSRPTKSLIAVITDLLGIGTCVAFACWLVQGRASAWTADPMLIPAIAIVSILIAWKLGLYRAVVRYIGFDLIVAGGTTASFATVAGAALIYVIDPVALPIRWAFAFWAFAAIYICSSRFFARLFLVRRPKRRPIQSVIIYGAGEAGAQLAASLQGAGDYVPVAMVDDDSSLHGKKVKGLMIYSPATIGSLVSQKDIKGVLLALPSASRRRRRQVLERLSEFPVRVQTMPDFKDIVSGKASVDEIKDVDVKDLLGRDPVPPNTELLCASVTRKNVMVTGAGGSIGSELCRQILKLNPKRLICFEMSEAALYSIDRELRQLLATKELDCELVPLLGSAHHEKRIQEALHVFDIETVYHAAAYKHVPIVEHNLFEGIHNNVFGTLHTARAAIDAGVERFVLISTDKAVNPTSVMGATKRLSEQVLQAYNGRTEKTRFCMVRFGNVLESSGSVVPLFREQIRNGGPVTVTHRDIIRYFMTIPEAAQLVIQAASMARGGDVFVLDMGKPVRIEDLAHRMISLMGLTVRDQERPDGDIEIQYIGLRPAEKLYEELLIGSNVSGTEHPRIMRADEEYLSYEELDASLSDLKDASVSLDYDRARRILLSAVKEYSPSNGIDDLVWLQKTGTDSDEPKIVEFPKPSQ